MEGCQLYVKPAAGKDSTVGHVAISSAIGTMQYGNPMMAAVPVGLNAV